MAPLARRSKTKFPTVYPTIYIYTSSNENFEHSCHNRIKEKLIELIEQPFNMDGSLYLTCIKK